MPTTTTPTGTPTPARWTREDYHRMLELGLFGDGRGVELIDGAVYDHGRPKVWTREEYYRLGNAGFFDADNRRVELIEGEIVLTPLPGPPHATAVDLTRLALEARLPAGCYVRAEKALAIAARRPNDPAPDLAVVEGEPRMYRVEHPATARLVVEISDSTLAYDQVDKLRLYAAAAIPAYWVLDLNGRVLHAYARPIGYGYADHEIIAEDATVRSPWSDERIAVADLLP